MEESISQRNGRTSVFILVMSIVLLSNQTTAQSIGYHPQFNLGFNPYSSPTFGYGLGLPFGAYNLSPAKNPLLLGSIAATAPFSDKAGFMGKAHAKAFLQKLATNQLMDLSAYPVGGGDFKDKLNMLKHPMYALSPYGTGYGYGKHYGSAMIPNYPYKSVYNNYYDSNEIKEIKVPNIMKANTLERPVSSEPIHVNNVIVPRYKFYSHYLKPILKTGAFITSLALLGKNILQTPARLNPTGMILQDVQP